MIDNNVLSRFVSGGEIEVPKEAWSHLNYNVDRSVIIDSLVDLILSGKIILPLRKITEAEATRSFLNLVGDDSNRIFSGSTFTRYSYSYGLDNLFISASNIGNKASDYFQQENRFACDSINAPSPLRTWKSERFLRTMFPALWSLKCKEVNSNILRTLLSLRKYTSSQFQPSVAKTLYNLFESKTVLDFSAGWGDRLCGFYASDKTRHYVGVDPNKSVFDKYFDQERLYKGIVSGKTCEFINKPAEEVEYQDNFFDTIATSPPYFNIERYSQDNTQSFKRYRKLEDWLNMFLFTAIEKAWKSLKRGGVLAINISDVYSLHTINKICDPMNYFIEKELGGDYLGGLGMRMAKRLNSGALKEKTGVFVEPIWIWRKRVF